MSYGQSWPGVILLKPKLFPCLQKKKHSSNSIDLCKWAHWQSLSNCDQRGTNSLRKITSPNIEKKPLHPPKYFVSKFRLFQTNYLPPLNSNMTILICELRYSTFGCRSRIFFGIPFAVVPVVENSMARTTLQTINQIETNWKVFSPLVMVVVVVLASGCWGIVSIPNCVPKQTSKDFWY